MSSVSLKNRRVAVIAAVCAFATAGIMLAGATSAHAAGIKTSVANGSSYAKAVAAGKTAGKAKQNAAAVLGVKVSLSGVKGTVSYKVSGASKSASAKNGKAAALKESVQTVSVKLTGKAKKKFDVYYRSYTPGYGWLGWAKNGETAGTKVTGKAVSAMQVKLVAKNKTVSDYKATKSVACIKADGFYNGLTGNAATDAQVAATAKNCDSLEDAFKAFYKKMSYADTGRDGLGYEFPAKRLLTEGKAAFAKGKGDCYTYSAGFTYVARYMGYEAEPVAGKLKNKYGKYNANSWVLVKNGERDEIWNPQLQYSCEDHGNDLVKQNKLVLDENGNPVGEGVYEMDADGKAKQYTIRVKTYGFTKDEINDYAKTYEELVFTGYGYAASPAEEI